MSTCVCVSVIYCGKCCHMVWYILVSIMCFRLGITWIIVHLFSGRKSTTYFNWSVFQMQKYIWKVCIWQCILQNNGFLSRPSCVNIFQEYVRELCQLTAVIDCAHSRLIAPTVKRSRMPTEVIRCHRKWTACGKVVCLIRVMTWLIGEV